MSKRLRAAILVVACSAACGEAGGQSTECKRYLACVRQLGGSTASLESRYGGDGTCWVDPTGVDGCTVYCKQALASFPREAGC